jgi:hypothetical protein
MLRCPKIGSGSLVAVEGRLNIVLVDESSKKNFTSPIR